MEVQETYLQKWSNLNNPTFHKELENAKQGTILHRYRRKRPKVDASILGSALCHTRRSDASKKRRKYARPFLDVFACGQVSSPRLYRLNFFQYFQLF